MFFRERTIHGESVVGRYQKRWTVRVKLGPYNTVDPVAQLVEQRTFNP